MAFDGFVQKAVVSELNSVLIGGKVQKIFEPTKNEILLGIYSGGKNYALVINIASDKCFMHLTTNAKPNPFVAPNFCMLLRKHLIGTKITNINSFGLERITEITFEGYNDLNDIITKKLMIELMGKHSNIILLNANNKIIDSMRHLDREEHSLRDILPAREYVLPPILKIDLQEVSSFLEFYNIIQEREIHSFSEISSVFSGLNKSLLNYLICKLDLYDFSYDNLEKLYSELKNIIISINKKEVELIPISDGKDYVIEKKLDASPLLVNFFLDDFYTSKEEKDTLLQYRNNVLKLILGKLKKLSKKLDGINQKLSECEDMDKYRIYGELLTANLYQIPKENSSSITVFNYYDNQEITIPLDNKISPSANTKAFFKKYHKLKNTLEIVEKQKQETKKEIDYLESIVYELETASNIKEIEEIYDEMVENDVIESKSKNTNTVKKIKNNPRVNTKMNITVGEPYKYKIEDFTVLVGKNNKQNDYLTTKLARKNDIWFHVKDFHGSHVILKVDGKTPSTSVLERCAKLAAYYSKAKQSSNVPVDFCPVANVKKPSGSKPGMVIYTGNKTLYVDPKIEVEN